MLDYTELVCVKFRARLLSMLDVMILCNWGLQGLITDHLITVVVVVVMGM